MASADQLQLPLFRSDVGVAELTGPYRDRLAFLLAQDLDFHDKSSAYSSHNFHSFPAKFPPQLPRRFIDGLTEPGDVVLDPMAGSGTTIVEALLSGRRAIALDIDPLALLLCRVKANPIGATEALAAGHRVLTDARALLQKRQDLLAREYERRFDPKTQSFIEYWFASSTRMELLALVVALEQVGVPAIRSFLQLALSSTIITKSGGVSLARDLGHTRPHRVDDKVPRSALVEFEKRLLKNVRSLRELSGTPGRVTVCHGDAQHMPLAPASVDIIVTSPPYASNAIDYMRAHKFSLVWLGHPLDTLSAKRREYIGGEATVDFAFETLSPQAALVTQMLDERDRKKGAVLRRYYSEMTRCIKEMFRVLKPGRAAIIVVGTSVMRGLDTLTHECLADIGRSVGFDVLGIATRRLDRDRRMMPARRNQEPGSQIELRMHEEYVLGLYKPG